MASVKETRESGIEIIDAEKPEDFTEDVEDVVLFRTEDPIEHVELGGCGAGHTAVTKEPVQHFISAAIDKEFSEMEQKLGKPERATETAIFISNEDWEIGSSTTISIEEYDNEAAIEKFENDYL